MAKFKKLSLAAATAELLVANGIEYIFGIGGHGNTPLIEALLPHARRKKIRVFDVHHEAVAAHAG